MSIQWPGGIITPTPATPTGPYQDGAAPGVWTIDQAAFWVKQGLWPIAGNLPPPTALFSGSSWSTITINTTGNAVAWGYNMAIASGCGSSTRGIFATTQDSTDIYYVDYATTGVVNYFGSCIASLRGPASCSNSTRGVIAGGYDISIGYVNTIQYVTIATTGNSTSFGILLNEINSSSGCASTTRGVYSGGFGSTPGYVNTIQYITIASTGNATSFGILSNKCRTTSSSSNATTGIITLGFDNSATVSNVIEYITIASTGNSTNFGQLTVARRSSAGAASSTRSVIAGGDTTGNGTGITNVIDYVTIATTGNATSFGSLTAATSGNAASSNAHGGL